MNNLLCERVGGEPKKATRSKANSAELAYAASGERFKLLVQKSRTEVLLFLTCWKLLLSLIQQSTDQHGHNTGHEITTAIQQESGFTHFEEQPHTC